MTKGSAQKKLVVSFKSRLLRGKRNQSLCAGQCPLMQSILRKGHMGMLERQETFPHQQSVPKINPHLLYTQTVGVGTGHALPTTCKQELVLQAPKGLVLGAACSPCPRPFELRAVPSLACAHMQCTGLGPVHGVSPGTHKLYHTAPRVGSSPQAVRLTPLG